MDFYSHAPRGARHERFLLSFSVLQFLLTRPSRGATQLALAQGASDEISTHTPLAGRDVERLVYLLPLSDFYSHAPRGARLGVTPPALSATEFLLTRPSRDATQRVLEVVVCFHISTHTPLAGRDKASAVECCRTMNFYSHAPRGARPMPDDVILLTDPISTHTPLAGRDSR